MENIRKNYRHTIYASYIGYITQSIVNNLAVFSPYPVLGLLGCGGGPTVVGFVAEHFSDNLKYGLFAARLYC